MTIPTINEKKHDYYVISDNISEGWSVNECIGFKDALELWHSTAAYNPRTYVMKLVRLEIGEVKND